MNLSKRFINTTILIIDDQPANLAVLVDFLENKEMDVVVAENGENGITRACYVQPGLILLDLLMPGIDGIETCLRLKKNKQTANIPVIFMTAIDELEKKVNAFKAGGVDYVNKPVQLEEVWSRIKAHLTISSLQTHLEQKNTQLQKEINERLLMEEKLRNMAITDDLTGLYNRRGLIMLTNNLLKKSIRDNTTFYLLFAVSTAILANTRSRGNCSHSTLIPVSGINSAFINSFVAWDGGVSSLITRIVVPE